MLLCTGCAYRVTLASLPEPAEIDLPGRRGTVVTPTEVTLRYVPFGHQRVRVRAPGYRVLEVDLRRTEIRLGRYFSDSLWRPATLAGGSRGTVRFVLVPEHGPVGTWEADEVP
jgi:hypothetical protein